MGRRNPCRQSRPGNRQLDLFSPAPATPAASMPDWRSLPEATRRTLTDLMTDLLVAHRHGGPTDGLREGTDDV